MNIKDFIIKKIDYDSVPEYAISAIESFEARNPNLKFLLGRSIKFGFFVLSFTEDKYEIVWVERNKGYVKSFLKDLKKENPLTFKEGKVSQHKTKARDGSQKIYPRIYVDGAELTRCGLEIGDDIKITYNATLNKITITKIRS